MNKEDKAEKEKLESFEKETIITFNILNAGDSISYAYQDYGSNISAADINALSARITITLTLTAGAEQTITHALGKEFLLNSTYRQIPSGTYYYGVAEWPGADTFLEFTILSLTSFKVKNTQPTTETYKIELY
jgi:hypothetical protein